MLTVQLSERDFNLVTSAMGLAAAEARHPGAMDDPGQYLEAMDRLITQLPGDGPAKVKARRKLALLDAGATHREVYYAAYNAHTGRRYA